MPVKPAANQRGFTLIEVLLVIAILGIMGAIAMPSFNVFRQNAQVRSPLMAAPQPASILNPSLNVEANSLVMVTQFMVADPVSILQNSIVNFREHRDEIVAAVDFVMQGF